MKLILKLFLLCLTSTLLIVFLAGGLVLLILSLLRWLLTGKRPQILTLMSKVNEWKKGNLWSFNSKENFTSSNSHPKTSDNIVDVEVKDVTQTEKKPAIAEH